MITFPLISICTNWKKTHPLEIKKHHPYYEISEFGFTYNLIFIIILLRKTASCPIHSAFETWSSPAQESGINEGQVREHWLCHIDRD